MTVKAGPKHILSGHKDDRKRDGERDKERERREAGRGKIDR